METLCVLMALWVAAQVGTAPAAGLRPARKTLAGHKMPTGLTGQDANGVPLRRSKRGWMWNQFFLLEEYTGNDMQYVGKVKRRLSNLTMTLFRGIQDGKILILSSSALYC